MKKKILSIAEKPSAAKKIAALLSKGGMSLGFSRSKYNPVFEFNYKFRGQEALMNFTSVAGHVVGFAFEEKYSKKYWHTAPQEHLFTTAKLEKVVPPEKQDLVTNIEKLAKDAESVILWLDCDREGEAIAFEVLRICQQVQPNIEVFRAHFSALTTEDIENAMKTLKDPDPNLADAVESRTEIDLRIGAAFTRYQTNLLKKHIPALAYSKVISYGPCQFPTLGFVVERWRKVRDFVPQPFWFISCKHDKYSQYDFGILISIDRLNQGGQKETVTFLWDRDNQLEKEAAEQLYKKCKATSEATVTSVVESQKQKPRPLPLSTVAMQKIATSKLKLSSHKVMEIAEKLYNKGFISYPRTETDFFPNTMNLRSLVQIHSKHPDWGQYATDLLEKEGFQWPRHGKKDDKAHPPIHPVKLATEFGNEFTPEEWKVYELVTRHFLACCSKDAKGSETVVKIQIDDESFHAKGLVIKEHNWLEVYPYDKWSGSVLPNFEKDEKFTPKELKLKESKTTPPSLLTEQELISAMDQNGIGTDATIHEHIKTIQDREYITKEGIFFKPTRLGIALVDAYEATGTDLWKPHLRAAMEANMTEIAQGNMKKEDFLKSSLTSMLGIFTQVRDKEELMLDTVRKVFADNESTSVKKYTNSGANSGTKVDISKIKCYKCGRFGHYANFCTQPRYNSNLKINLEEKGDKTSVKKVKKVVKTESTTEDKPSTEQKICPICGHVGRHPNGSTCSAVKRKTAKKEEVQVA